MIYRLKQNVTIYGRRFPAGSVVYEDSYTFYICTNFQRYKGNVDGIMNLWLWIVDRETGEITRDILGNNNITRGIWKFYEKTGKGKPEKLYRESEIKSYMSHERRHKKGSGAKISGANTITDYDCVGVAGHAVRTEKYWHDRRLYNTAI